MGAIDQERASPRGRCRRGTSTRPSASSISRTIASLTDAQIDTIVRWVDAGAPQGDPKDMPAPRDSGRRSARWQFADAVRRARPGHQVAAVHACRRRRRTSGGRPVVETGLTEPRWVRAIEIRPATRQGPPHHASRARAPEAGRRRRCPAEHRQRAIDGRRRGAGTVHGVGGRQAGRADAARTPAS